MFFLIAATALFAAAGPAGAQTAADAEAAIAKGIEFRRQGQDRQALAEFERAAAIQKTPRVTAQIGFAEQALGFWIRAEAHLQQALADRTDPWIQRNAGTLEEALRFIQTHLGSVEVWGTPAGAEVLLDGQLVGTLPMDRPIRVTNSEVTMQVRAKGYASITRTMQVPRGRHSVREQVDLHALLLVPDQPPAVPAAPPKAVAPPEPPRIQTPPPVDQPPARDNRRLQVAVWTTAAAAGLSLAAGTTFLLLGKSKSDSFNGDDSCDLVNGRVVEGAGGSHCQQLYDAWHTNRTVGYVGLALGGVLAATSAVLFVRLRDASATSVAAAQGGLVACGPGAGAGVACVLRF